MVGFTISQFRGPTSIKPEDIFIVKPNTFDGFIGTFTNQTAPTWIFWMFLLCCLTPQGTWFLHFAYVAPYSIVLLLLDF